MRLHRLGLLTLVAGFYATCGFVAPSSAGVIGPTGCAGSSCHGVKYTLDNVGNQDGGSLTQDIWRISLTADTTDYTGDASDWISGVSVKVFGGTDITAVTLFSTTALGGWSAAQEGKVNNCGGNENGGVCTETASQLTVTNGSTYSWVFDITTLEGAQFVSDSSIQVQFLGINPNNGKIQNQGITSEEISLDPPPPPPPPAINISEPYPLAAIGLALLILGAVRRRA